MDTIGKLRFYMDESSAPYSESDAPIVRTKEDDEFDDMIIAKYHLVTEEKEKNLTFKRSFG